MNIFRSENKRHLLVFGLLGAVLILVLMLSLMALFAPKEVPNSAHLASVRSESVKGQAGGVGSDEYNRKLGEHDHKQANQALKMWRVCPSMRSMRSETFVSRISPLSRRISPMIRLKRA